jgi:adenine-specific DNA glycosylase
MGYSVTQIRNVGRMKHIFTHIEWQMQVYRCTVNKVEAPYLTDAITLPTAFRKLLRIEKETK